MCGNCGSFDSVLWFIGAKKHVKKEIKKEVKQVPITKVKVEEVQNIYYM